MGQGEVGDCGVRGNVGGDVQALAYGQPCSVGVDPIEKKPLFHVRPGSPILSLATAGCNLHCAHCQNWQISQAKASDLMQDDLPPARVPVLAREHGASMVAYTYTEPVVSFEYTRDCCEAAKASHLLNVLVTAAYVNPEPLRELCECVDAANVDLKAFSDDFYREICNASLAPVLKAIKQMKEMGVFLELTNLLIPTLNDSESDIKKMTDWIVRELGEDTPLHVSGFFPQHRLRHLPATSEDGLLKARDIAKSSGLHFVYIGNLLTEDGETTFCPGCSRAVIERQRYTVVANHLKDGACPACGANVAGVW